MTSVASVRIRQCADAEELIVFSVYLTCTISNKVRAVSVFAVLSGPSGLRVCDSNIDVL